MLELLWTILLIWIAIRIVWWGFGHHFRPKPPRIQPRLSTDDAHDAAISIAAVLGVRDGRRRE